MRPAWLKTSKVGVKMFLIKCFRRRERYYRKRRVVSSLNMLVPEYRPIFRRYGLAYINFKLSEEEFQYRDNRIYEESRKRKMKRLLKENAIFFHHLKMQIQIGDRCRDIINFQLKGSLTELEKMYISLDIDFELYLEMKHGDDKTFRSIEDEKQWRHNRLFDWYTKHPDSNVTFEEDLLYINLKITWDEYVDLCNGIMDFQELFSKVMGKKTTCVELKDGNKIYLEYAEDAFKQVK